MYDGHCTEVAYSHFGCHLIKWPPLLSIVLVAEIFINILPTIHHSNFTIYYKLMVGAVNCKISLIFIMVKGT